MSYLMIEFRWIFGFMVGFEWTPIGEQDEDYGFFCIDLGILRLLFTYGF